MGLTKEELQAVVRVINKALHDGHYKPDSKSELKKNLEGARGKLLSELSRINTQPPHLNRQ